MPGFPELPSAKAALIRDLLREKKARTAERAFVIEGGKPIRDLLRGGAASLLAIVVTEAWLEAAEAGLRRALGQGAVPVYSCGNSVFERLSDVRTAQGILAVVRRPLWDQDAILKRGSVFGMFGECLQDPANVGAIIRTAAAFGLDALWLSPDSADVYAPKVVRATAGALLTLPVLSAPDVGVFAGAGCAILASEPSGGTSQAIRTINRLPRRAVLALGNESRGLSQAVLKQAAIRFHIPVSPAVESLNVAASAAIAAFYFSGLPKERPRRGV